MEIINTSRFRLIYLDEDIIIFSPKEKFNELDLNQSIITNHTENTWEKNRDKNEISKNTKQGKIIEEFFADLIDYKNSISNNIKLEYITYDQIRQDEFKKHAPFDGLLFKQGNPYIKEVIDKINEYISTNKYGKLNSNIINFCAKHKVYLIEIKSSKIPDKIYNEAKKNYIKHLNNTTFQRDVINSLKKLDLFKYPVFTRNNGSIIHDTKDYLQWVKDNIYFMKGKNDKEILDYEINESLNLYTRIFIDDKKIDKNNGKPIFIGYFLGYVLGYEFYHPLTIMNFPSNKSKDAIYATYPISKSRKFESLFDDDRLW
nr:hypothetical protein [uncultured Haemophilus sp.]